jgi:ferrous iron transport protein A
MNYQEAHTDLVCRSHRSVMFVVDPRPDRGRMTLKMIFKFGQNSPAPEVPNTLSDLEEGESGVLGHLHAPASVAEHLMNLGFIPGVEVTMARTGPGGDPCIFRVDGTEVALRRELSKRLHLRLPDGAGA